VKESAKFNVVTLPCCSAGCNDFPEEAEVDPYLQRLDVGCPKAIF